MTILLVEKSVRDQFHYILFCIRWLSASDFVSASVLPPLPQFLHEKNLVVDNNWPQIDYIKHF